MRFGLRRIHLNLLACGPIFLYFIRAARSLLFAMTDYALQQTNNQPELVAPCVFD
jgi:hypothetical protein